MIKIHVAREGRCVHISSGNNCVSMTYEELKSFFNNVYSSLDLDGVPESEVDFRITDLKYKRQYPD